MNKQIEITQGRTAPADVVGATSLGASPAQARINGGIGFLTRHAAFILIAGFFCAGVFLASTAWGDDRATGHISATVCQRVDIGNGFAYYDCGEQPIPPSDEPDARGFIPDVPEKSVTIADTGEPQ